MMEAARASETMVNFYQTTRRYNPEDSHLRTHRRENLKSNDLHDLFSFPDNIRVTKSRRMRWAGHHREGERRNIYILIGKCERKRPVERQRCNGKDYIKMGLKETELLKRTLLHGLTVTLFRAHFLFRLCFVR
jgi:hypothetical protein